MKKLFLVLSVILLVGCGVCVRQSELFQHDTLYKDWRHMWFSVAGYRNIDATDVRYSAEYRWWGIPKTYQGEKEATKATP